MTTKARQKKEAVAIADTESLGQMIPIGYLETSSTNPRRRFPSESINELAASIRDQGIIEPLVVRAKELRKNGDPAFEIVCGERRYRASWDVNGFEKLEKLPCIVRDLTDEQVLDIQIHENLHREDVHPMDEASGYQFLMDTLNCDVKEVAARVGKSEAFVLNRLKLNNLIEEAKADVEAGVLPISHALEIAKFNDPVVQARILNEGCFQTQSKWNSRSNEYEYSPVKEKPETLRHLLNFINLNVLHQLTGAPFDKKATNLRPDGLSCVKCPDRTGASVGLFENYEIGKKDNCLNINCFKAKMDQHVENVRARIAHEADLAIEDVPLVNPGSYGSANDGILRNREVRLVEDKDAALPGVIQAVSVDPKNFGQPVYVQLKSADGLNGSGSAASKGSADVEREREAELDKKRQRREEIFDCRVSDIVRMQVFHIAAQKFADSFEMTGEGPGTFTPELITKIMLTSNNDIDGSTVARVVIPIMREAMDDASFMHGGAHYRFYGSSDTKTSTYTAIDALSEHKQKMMLFLCVHGNKGQTYNETWRSQIEVEALAEYYGINYRLLDAQARLQIAEEKAKKHVEKFKLYLAAVESGADAEVPRIWSENWKPANKDGRFRKE
jgi:ParB/RepB/Spo0J family partition protein